MHLIAETPSTELSLLEQQIPQIKVLEDAQSTHEPDHSQDCISPVYSVPFNLEITELYYGLDELPLNWSV